MNWEEVVSNPSLQNLPFKIELNERGQIIMNPVKLKHSAFQSKIGYIMETMRQDGIVLVECAIQTRKGTKVADTAWYSLERWNIVQGETDASVAPEVCVEVLSISNTEDEMKERKTLYFERGAKEVWICDEYGLMSFYNSKRKIKRSSLFPDFPNEVGIRLKEKDNDKKV